MKDNMRITRIAITTVTVAFLLSGCSGYSSKFTCGSSHGAKCVMISEIDKMIDSGEIEEYHINRKCKGNKKCLNAVKPKTQIAKYHEIIAISPNDITE